MNGRDMDKAKKETRWTIVALLVLLGWIMYLISLLPKHPMPRDWYMTGLEMLMADALALLLLSVLVILGIVIGRYIEARLYQKNGRYLGKGETT